MRWLWRLMTLLFGAVGVVFFLYPFLHELGHLLCGLLVGGTLKGVSWYPAPGVWFDLSGTDDVGYIATALAGIYLPYLYALSLHPKHFFPWFLSYTFKGMVLLSLLLSMGVVLLYSQGQIVAGDDLVKVLTRFEEGTWLIFVGLFLSVVVLLSEMRTEQPIRQLQSFLLETSVVQQAGFGEKKGERCEKE